MYHILLPFISLFLTVTTAIPAPAIPTGVSYAMSWFPDPSVVGPSGLATHFTSCTNNTHSTTAPAGYNASMTTCLSSYNNGDSNWAGQDCNSLGWFKGTHGGYQNATDCWQACQGCLAQSFEAGSEDAICYDVYSVNVPESTVTGYLPMGTWTGCFMGFHAA
ncbi:MAG: hypothetical protein M1827_005607 [Pycnora praestabilis]|nr:MAG: hypothetical protein M1827_005607 [Pycnora praestabilis]